MRGHRLLREGEGQPLNGPFVLDHCFSKAERGWRVKKTGREFKEQVYQEIRGTSTETGSM